MTFSGPNPDSEWPPPVRSAYVREEAGTQRYNVGTDTPWLCPGFSTANPNRKPFFVLREILFVPDAMGQNRVKYLQVWMPIAL
jgi:hypothetical protein